MLLVRSLAVAMFGIISIWAAGFIFLPEKTQAIYERLRDNVDIAFSPDCTTEPASCLLRLKHNLERVSKRLERTRMSLETESTQADDMVMQNRQVLEQNRLYLSQGRKILRTASTDTPIRFIGIDYPSAEKLREQLELLFREGERLEDVLARSEALSAKLKNTRREIIAQHSAVLAALVSIPRKIALAKAETAYAALESDLSQLDTVLSGGQSGSNKADQLMRSTKRLNQDAARSPEGNADFANWLSGEDE